MQSLVAQLEQECSSSSKVPVQTTMKPELNDISDAAKLGSGHGIGMKTNGNAPPHSSQDSSLAPLPSEFEMKEFPQMMMRRDSMESTTSLHSGRSVCSMNEEGVDTLGWSSSRTSFFDRRRRTSRTPSNSLAGMPLNEADVEEGEFRDKRTRSAASTDGTESVLSAGSASDDDNTEAAPSPPPKPSRPGPLRFTPRRSIQCQVDELFAHERCCFDSIKFQWETYSGKGNHCTSASQVKNTPSRSRGRRIWSNTANANGGRDTFSDALYLHFSRAAGHDEGATLALMRQSNKRLLSLTCASLLEEQLRTKTLFIVPGLMSREGLDVFYMRPSRYFPKQTKTSTIIDNLAYIMKVMLENEHSSRDGIAFMANMKGWEMTNFSITYCLQFMETLQAKHFPVEVQSFLIVDPPIWFDKIWKIMKTMLTPSFQKRVRMIPSSELGVYLSDGYRMFLPDDMEGGVSCTDDIVADFIEYRKYAENVVQ